jgi:hypothetical protein
MRKYAAILLMFLAASTAQAADVWHASTISSVYPQADGAFIVTFHTNSPSCTSPSNYYTVRVSQNGMTDEGARRIYAASLTALALGKTVNINFSDTTTSCYVNRLSVED